MKKLPSRFTRPRWRRAGPVVSAEFLNAFRKRVDPIAVWLFVVLCVADSLAGILGSDMSTRHARFGKGSGKRPGKGSGKRPGNGPDNGPGPKGFGKHPGDGPGPESKRPGKAGKPENSPVATARPSSAPVQVFVRTDWGERCLQLSLSATGADAKKAILRECAPPAPPGGQACPASAVWLKCGGNAVRDSETLADAGVRAGSRLSLEVVRGGGGGGGGIAAEDAKQTTAASASTQPPLRERIALMEPRHERDGWKKQAEERVDVQAQSEVDVENRHLLASACSESRTEQRQDNGAGCDDEPFDVFLKLLDGTTKTLRNVRSLCLVPETSCVHHVEFRAHGSISFFTLCIEHEQRVVTTYLSPLPLSRSLLPLFPTLSQAQ